MKRYTPALDERYRELARARLVRGDLFAFPYPVVTIMTGGRFYGSLSRTVVSAGVEVPDLAFGCAAFARTGVDKSFVFVALWNDGNEYSPKQVYDCTRACVKQAQVHGLPQLAMPLLGGNERASFVGAMDQAIDHAEDEAGEAEAEMPEVVLVTDLELL